MALAMSSRVHSGFSESGRLTVLFVVFGFMFCRLSQADRPEITAIVLGEYQRVQSRIKKSYRAETNLSVVLAVIDLEQRGLKIKVIGSLERDAVLLLVGCILLRIEDNLHVRSPLSNCIYDKRLQSTANQCIKKSGEPKPAALI